MNDNGYSDLKEFCDKNFKVVKKNYVQRADLVMVSGALGLCLGHISYFIFPDKKLKRVTTGLIEFAWRFK